MRWAMAIMLLTACEPQQPNCVENCTVTYRTQPVLIGVN